MQSLILLLSFSFGFPSYASILGEDFSCSGLLQGKKYRLYITDARYSQSIMLDYEGRSCQIGVKKIWLFETAKVPHFKLVSTGATTCKGLEDVIVAGGILEYRWGRSASADNFLFKHQSQCRVSSLRRNKFSSVPQN